MQRFTGWARRIIGQKYVDVSQPPVFYGWGCGMLSTSNSKYFISRITVLNGTALQIGIKLNR